MACTPLVVTIENNTGITLTLSAVDLLVLNDPEPSITLNLSNDPVCCTDDETPIAVGVFYDGGYFFDGSAEFDGTPFGD